MPRWPVQRTRTNARATPRTATNGARVAALYAAGFATACGLSTSGTGDVTTTSHKPMDAATLDVDVDAAPADVGATGDGSPKPLLDSAPVADVFSIDGPAETGGGPPPCSAVDAGLDGVLSLKAFVTEGSASYDENNDNRITLTNSANGQSGAAWYPSPMPQLSGYDLTWTLRIGPGGTAGDGIAFALLQTHGVPDVGGDGSGIGLQGIEGADGGTLAGYAVDVDTFKNDGDPTDLGPTTLKLVAMPSFTVVANVGIPDALNDGNDYEVDVSWRAPSDLWATLHGPQNKTYAVMANDPGLAASTPYFGFTAATGADSNSHNEIAGITFLATCK